jgi:hypothetical protein
MRPASDLMERLAAADPLRDAGHLTPEDQREADELLARLLATPPGPDGEERRASGPRLGRRAVVAAGVACVAAAVAAVNLLDPDAPRAGVVDKAVAAVTRADSVYHVLERTRMTASGSNGEGRTFYVESWLTSDGRIHQKRFAARGERRGELLLEVAGKRRPGRASGPALMYQPRSNTVYPIGFGWARRGNIPMIDPYGDPGVQLRELREQGRLRPAGMTRVGERAGYRLVSGPVPGPQGSEERVEFLVDAETYLPLAQRHSRRAPAPSAGSAEFFTRYLVYERLPLDAHSRTQLDLDHHPGARCATGAGDREPSRLWRETVEAVGFPNPC